MIPVLATAEELTEQVTLDSKVLAEQFYFWTVVVMWLIHAGFMAYEAGVARRKNVMATAMKNILTIAVVTPPFYYFGWWIYGCMERGFMPTDPDGAYWSAVFDLSAFCKSTAAWGETSGPNLTDNITGSSGRRSCCSVDDGLDHVRRADRAGAPDGLPVARRSSAPSCGSSTRPGAGAPAAG